MASLIIGGVESINIAFVVVCEDNPIRLNPFTTA